MTRRKSLVLLMLGALWAFTMQPVRAESAKLDSATIAIGAAGKMQAVLMTPAGPGPFPGILVLQTSTGEQPEDMGFARRLVREGYVVMVPYFLEAYKIDASTPQAAFTTQAEAIYADLTDGLAQLSKNRKVISKKLGAIGFSNGGYFALWLAATGQVQAGISYYGALTGAGSDDAMDRFHKVFSGTSAPVLILHGEADFTVPVSKAVELNSILTAAGTPLEFHAYRGAAHRFDRETGSANQDAAGDAWLRSRDFFAKYLKK
jgi:carboxymethylenebutenolidase